VQHFSLQFNSDINEIRSFISVAGFLDSADAVFIEAEEFISG
jgi:hypothetical protein